MVEDNVYVSAQMHFCFFMRINLLAREIGNRDDLVEQTEIWIKVFSRVYGEFFLLLHDAQMPIMKAFLNFEFWGQAFWYFFSVSVIIMLFYLIILFYFNLWLKPRCTSNMKYNFQQGIWYNSRRIGFSYIVSWNINKAFLIAIEIDLLPEILNQILYFNMIYGMRVCWVLGFNFQSFIYFIIFFLLFEELFFLSGKFSFWAKVRILTNES